MKVIITESQFKELNNSGDIYKELNPYLRRRIDYINIPEKIKEKLAKIKNFYAWYDDVDNEYLVNKVIQDVVWETVPSYWDSSDYEKLEIEKYVDEMIEIVQQKFGETIMKIINKFAKKK